MPYINKGFVQWTGIRKTNDLPSYAKYDWYNLPDFIAVAVIDVPATTDQETCYQYVAFNTETKSLTGASATLTYSTENTGTTGFTTQSEIQNQGLSWQLVNQTTSPYALYYNFAKSSSFPVYASMSDFLNSKYYENGDYSDSKNYGDLIGAICNFTVNIIGTYRPNFQISWECPAVTDGYISADFCTINLQFEQGGFSWNPTYSYSQGNVTLTYDLIMSYISPDLYIKLVNTLDGDFDALAGYFEFLGKMQTTELQSDTTLDGRWITSSVGGDFNGKSDYKNLRNGTDGSTITVIKNGNQNNTDDGYTNFNDDDESNNVSEDGGSGDDTTGVLTRSYVVSIDTLNNIANKLWNADFLDNLQLLNNNPIENIISCKLIPASFTNYVSTPIMIGNVDMGINGDKLIDNGGLRRFVSSYLIRGKYDSFLDYDPYTKFMILLPRIGICSLPTNMIMKRTINVDYVFDIITGMCKAIVSINTSKGEVIIGEYDGTAGIEIPITSGNRTQQEVGFITGIVNAGMGVANKDIGAVINGGIGAATSGFHSETTGTSNPSVSSFLKNNIVLYCERPTKINSTAYPHTYGMPCQLSKKLSSLNGFTILNQNVDLSSLSCSEQEKEMLLSILTTGFFIT